jgi:TRAP-type mannitol/chloroaromatic compound transport system substrate-binding protein
MKVAAYDMYIQSYHESAINLASLQQDYPNVKLRTFPKPVMDAIQRTNAELLKESAAKDPMTAEILQSLSDYQSKARAWTNLSDKAYLDNFEQK